MQFHLCSSSFTEDDLRNLVEDHGGEVATVRMGLDKFGALVHMETKESGVKVIKEMDEMELKGREIFVKWRDDGMWTCPDPSCGYKIFLGHDAFYRCRFPASNLKLFKKVVEP